MMANVSRLAFLAVVLLLPRAAAAADLRDEMLVTPAWLAQHLSDSNLVLLHVGEKPEYDARHIPGARFVTTRDVSSSEPGLTLEMSTPDKLRTQLSALGISDDSRVVVYYGKDWVSPSTRIVFTLLYAGLTQVSLLDGGMDAWTKEGHPVTDVVPPARTGSLSPLTTKPLVVDAAFVQAHVNTPRFAVVDARTAPFYSGAQPGGPSDHRKAGHIAGARSVPFSDLITDDVRFKPREELAALFAKAGVQPGDTVIAYCHIGQQATALMFAARTLGHPVLLYDGSFEDWSRRDLPVDNPSAGKDR
jgi:thiosulfate/3-mercaptopyruvate sulfurtransferase